LSVKHAVLGLLIEEPGYPYDVMLRMRERLGMWQAATSVNKAFDQLDVDGHIRRVRDSNWSEATPEGREFFEGWLLEPVGAEAPPLRSELLMKVGFPAASDELLVQLYRGARRQEQWCVDQIAELSDRGDLEALAERGKDWPAISPVLIRDAYAAYLKATSDYARTILREARRVYEMRTGRRLVVDE
jgi:DNA-binding PadR family transcriptional regulator